MILYPIRENGKMGFINQIGDIVIAPRFQNPQLHLVHHHKSVDFTDWVPVMLNNHWGYIDATGEFQIEPTFELADWFSEDLAPVGQIVSRSYNVPQGLWGCIDRKCELVIPYQWANIDGFTNGQAIVERLHQGDDGVVYPESDSLVIDRQGNILPSPVPGRCGRNSYIHENGTISLWYDDDPDTINLEPVSNGARYGFKNATGDLAIPCVYDEVDYFRREEGLCTVRVGKLWGVIDHTGEMVIEPQFLSPLFFSEGLAMAKVKVPVVESGKRKLVTRYGFVDTRGEWAIEPQFTAVPDDPPSFQDGLALVNVGKARAYVNHAGLIVWKEKPTE